MTSETLSPSESDLMTRAARGDRAAFAQIMLIHQDRLFNALFRLVGDGDEAAQLAQETFSRGLDRAGESDESISPYVKLLRIALSLAVVSLRRSRRNRSFTAAADLADPSHHAVAEAMGRLDIDYRAALVLRDIDGMDDLEMSVLLDLPPAAVRSRLFRARLALRDELHGQLDGFHGQ
jgi:RNA polymerase sigma-70 factor, ECF subfamily